MKVMKMRLAIILLICIMVNPMMFKHFEGEVENNLDGNITTDTNVDVNNDTTLDA